MSLAESIGTRLTIHSRGPVLTRWITEATSGRVVARLPLTEKHMNSKGGLHGSVSATIVDWMGGMAIASKDLRRKTGVSVEIHVTYQNSANDGDEIEIEGLVEKLGSSLAFTRVTVRKVIEDKAGPIIVTGTHTKFAKL
ncbi:hypothetical protein LTR66_007999 [Elasticomyces elasticus]|nr:hypothetical protein LTR66_007999 [Elasticomyces elasticus]